MHKDVITDRYARLYEHAHYLAENHALVTAYCLAYYSSRDTNEIHETSKGLLKWQSWYVGKLFWRFPIIIIEIFINIFKDRPQHIVAASDQVHIILGLVFSKLLKTTFSIDLYDNFESYGTAKIPFVNYLFRKALNSANVVTCVSPLLKQKVLPLVSSKCNIDVLLSTVDLSLFHYLDKKACRKELKLPNNSILIGTAGNLRRNMDIATVYKAFEILNLRISGLTFILAGTIDKNVPLPQINNLIYLGRLNYDKIPLLFNSLDVGIIYQSTTEYGLYAFPQKALEMVACSLPIVACDVGSIGDIFPDSKKYLYESGNAASLADKIELQISDRFRTKIVFEDWEAQGLRLFKMIVNIK